MIVMIIRDILLIFLSWLLGVIMTFMYIDEKDKEKTNESKGTY